MNSKVSKYKDLASKMKKDQGLEDYVFNNLAIIELFPPLYAEGFFDISKIPPAKIENENVIARKWNTLTFLISIVEKYKEKKDAKKYFDMIADIYLRAANHISKVEERQPINWIVALELIRLLTALPSEYITLEMIIVLEKWKNDHSVAFSISAEICSNLFPKLLSDAQREKGKRRKENIKKAEELFDIILSFKPNSQYKMDLLLEEKKDFLFQEYWVVGETEKVTEQIAELFSDDAISKVKTKLEDLLFSEIESRDYSLRVGDKDILEIKVNISTDGTNSGRNFFLTYLKDKQSPPSETLIDFHKSRNEFVKRSLSWIEDDLKIPCNQETQTDLRRLHASIHAEGSYQALRENSRRYGEASPLVFLSTLYAQIMRTRIKITSQEKSRGIIKELLNEKFLIFPKIALYLIAEDIPKLKEIFLDAVTDSHNADVLFEGLYFGAELKKVLSGLSTLSNDERNILAKKIEGGSDLHPDIKADVASYDIWRQERYHALKHDPIFNAKFEETKNRTKREAELTAAIGEVIAFWSDKEQSPVPVDGLIAMPYDDLKKLFLNFKPDLTKFDTPSIEGLSEALESAVSCNPQHFLEGLREFNDIGYLWAKSILSGFSKTIGKNPSLSSNAWEYILPFIKEYTARDEFWGDNLITSQIGSWRVLHESVLDEFASLVRNASREEIVKDANIINKIIYILRDFIAKVKRPDTGQYEDVVMNAINTTIGKLFEAFIDASLLLSRVNSELQRGSEKWEKENSDFTKELFDQEIKEIYTIFGMRLRNFLHLNYDWAISNAKLIIERKHWDAFFTGYVQFCGYYDVLYEQLNKYYAKAIEEKHLESEARKYLIDHCLQGYLRGREKFDCTGNLYQLTTSANQFDVKELIFNGARQAKSTTEMLADPKLKAMAEERSLRVLALWKKLLEVLDNLKDLDKRKDDKVKDESYATLAEWLGFVVNLDNESIELITKTASQEWAKVYLLSDFFTNLADLCERNESTGNGEAIAQIVLEILKKYIPEYEKEEVERIVTWIYRDSKAHGLANKICETLARNGAIYLNEIYKSNNRPPKLI